MSQLDSNQRPTFEQGCSTAELCSYPTYDVLTRWFRMLLTSGMPHAVSASRRETLLRCLSGPRHCRPKRISDRAPCAPQTARPPLAANLGPSDLPTPPCSGSAALRRWSSAMARAATQNRFRTADAPGATPSLRANTLSGTVASSRLSARPATVLDIGYLGRDPSVSDRLPSSRPPALSGTG